MGPACEAAFNTRDINRGDADPRLRGGASFGPNGSSFLDAMKALQLVLAYLSVDGTV